MNLFPEKVIVYNVPKIIIYSFIHKMFGIFPMEI